MKSVPFFKALLCVALSLMMGFTCIGYAAISGSLSVAGHATYERPPIYISSVVPQSGSFTNEFSFGTTMKSSVTLGTSSSSSCVVAITVKNRTSVDYGYNATLVGTDTQSWSNSNIVYAVYSDAACTKRLAKKTLLAPETTAEGANGLTFYLKFTYKSGYSPSSAQTLSSVMNFDFKTPVDSIIDDAAVDNAVDQFYDILNDHIRNVDYNTLINAMNNAGNDRNISYMGNVSGAAAADIAVLEMLFEGQLSVNIDGQQKNVKFLLKRENIDGNTATGGAEELEYRDGYGNQSVTGWEMVMYMTTETLSSYYSWKTVYAIVFTSYDGGITWVQIGEMFEGEARVCDYEGGWGSGSFNTDTWRSTKSYYNLGTKQSIEKLVEKIPKN